MPTEELSDMGSCAKAEPRAIINLNYSDEVVLRKGNITAILRITSDGDVVGTIEKAVKLSAPK